MVAFQGSLLGIAAPFTTLTGALLFTRRNRHPVAQGHPSPAGLAEEG